MTQTAAPANCSWPSLRRCWLWLSSGAPASTGCDVLLGVGMLASVRSGQTRLGYYILLSGQKQIQTSNVGPGKRADRKHATPRHLRSPPRQLPLHLIKANQIAARSKAADADNSVIFLPGFNRQIWPSTLMTSGKWGKPGAFDHFNKH